MIITIGRQLAAGGREIGKRLAEKLSLKYYDRELILEAGKHSGLNPQLFEQVDEQHNLFMYALGAKNPELFRIQADVIARLAEQDNCVFVGRCADYILRDKPNCLSIFLSADLDDRIKRISIAENCSAKQALEIIEKADRKRAEYYEFYTGKGWGKACSYDFCLNTTWFGVSEVVDLVSKAALHLQK